MTIGVVVDMSMSLTVEQIKTLLFNKPSDEIIAYLEQDERLSVKKMLKQWHKKQVLYKKEVSRLHKLYKYEKEYYRQGYNLIAGVDEAGRGPLAGPLVVASVILPPEAQILQLNDSKQLSAKVREKVYQEIKTTAINVCYKVIDVNVIDKLNIYQATVSGMYDVITQLDKVEAVLVDAVLLKELTIPSLSIINGDALSASIAAASVVAKVERDRIMYELDKIYPQYGFARHKGYATHEHLQALKIFGPSPVHRKSFAPIKNWEDSAREHKRNNVRNYTEFDLFTK